MDRPEGTGSPAYRRSTSWRAWPRSWGLNGAGEHDFGPRINVGQVLRVECDDALHGDFPHEVVASLRPWATWAGDPMTSAALGQEPSTLPGENQPLSC